MPQTREEIAAEKAALDVNLAKLTKHLASPAHAEHDERDRGLAQIQHGAMLRYSEILHQRLNPPAVEDRSHRITFPV